MKVGPRVSVLMPVHNGARHVERAIESILSQSFRDFEFIIVDDGSTDDTARILSSFHDPRIRVVKHENVRGITHSLNQALAEAHGEFIARQDADDLSHEDRLRRQVLYLDQHAHIALVGTQARRIYEDSVARISPAAWRATTPTAVKFESLFGNPFIHTSVMYRRRIVSELGGYDEHYRAGQDFELWSRLLRDHDAVNLPEYLVDYRIRLSSVSRTSSSSDRGPIEPMFARALAYCNIDCQALGDWPTVWSRALGCCRLDKHELEKTVAAARSCIEQFALAWSGGIRAEELRRIYSTYILQLASLYMSTQPWVAMRLLGEAYNARGVRLLIPLATWTGRRLREFGYRAIRSQELR